MAMAYYSTAARGQGAAAALGFEDKTKTKNRRGTTRMSQETKPVAPYSSSGCQRYPLLFGIQTIGAAITPWHAISYYREILADPSAFDP